MFLLSLFEFNIILQKKNHAFLNTHNLKKSRSRTVAVTGVDGIIIHFYF